MASEIAPPSNGTASPVVKICVYCGSSAGTNPAHIEAARSLARLMAKNNISLVYGGGTVGLMGEVAKTLVSLSGPDSVHGIIPAALVHYERDDTYQADPTTNTHVPKQAIYGRTTVVKDMHERKRMMAQEVFAGAPGSGFIALSGGYGTIEEILETATWNQLGIHQRGICLLSINGFWDGLLSWVDHAASEGFIHSTNRDIIVKATDPESAINALRDYKPSVAALKLKWGDE